MVQEWTKTITMALAQERVELSVTSVQQNWLTQTRALDQINTFRVARGVRLYPAGTPATRLIFLYQGRILLSCQRANEGGGIITVRAPSVVGEAALVGRTHVFTAEVLDDSIIRSLDAERWHKVVEKDPQFGLAIVRELAQREEELEARKYQLSTMKAPQRVADALLTLVLAGENKVPFTHKNIAWMAGTRRETTSDILGSMRRLGIILTGRGEVLIENHQLLEKIAKGQDPFS